MEDRSSDERAKLFSWVDSLGNDTLDLFVPEMSQLMTTSGQRVAQQKVTVEDYLIDLYVGGNLRRRFDKIRIIFIFCGSRIFPYLDESEIFNLMEVDEFIGGRAMSYRFFTPQVHQSNPSSLVKYTNSSFLTSNNTSEVSKTTSKMVQSVLPKTEQAMLRIRKTNLVLNRPDSRKASIVSKGDTTSVMNGIFASQISRPDTAESVTSSRVRLAPISSGTMKQQQAHLSHPTASLKHPNTEEIGSKMFSIPFSAQQQLVKNPQTYEMHFLRFAESVVRAMQTPLLEYLAKKTSLTDCLQEVRKVLRVVQAEAKEFEGRGSGGANQSKFWELIQVSSKLNTELDSCKVPQELEQLDNELLQVSSAKTAIKSSEQYLDIACSSFSTESPAGGLLLAVASIRLFSHWKNFLASSRLVDTPTLLGPSPQVPFLVKFAAILSRIGKTLVPLSSNPLATSLLPSVDQQCQKQLRHVRQVFDVVKTVAKLLQTEGGGSVFARVVAQSGTGDSLVRLWNEDAADRWEKVKQQIQPFDQTSQSPAAKVVKPKKG